MQCSTFLSDTHSQITVTLFQLRSADGKQAKEKKWIVLQSKSNKLPHARCRALASIKTRGGGQESHAGVTGYAVNTLDDKAVFTGALVSPRARTHTQTEG